MKKLAKRNKINVIGISTLYFSLCLISIVLAVFLFLVMFNDDLIIATILSGILFIITIPLFTRNTKELYRILKLLNNKPEYYLELDDDVIRVNALDKEYDIKFTDIERLNYSYDRSLICANFLLMYGNHKYKLNTNSEKAKSMYMMFDLSNEFVKTNKNIKNKKHGILLITTKDYFFVLPEIDNVEECFEELKVLINYTHTSKDNENNYDINFIGKIYSQIVESHKKGTLDYNEEKFVSLANMIEGSFDFDIEKNIQYLEELGAIHYVELLKKTKIEIDNSKINNRIVNPQDIAVELFNQIRILDEKDPFYKTYLIPFAKENLSKYIN